MRAYGYIFAAFVLAAPSAALAAQQGPSGMGRCVNPNVNVPLSATSPRTAESAPVQFDVGMGPGPGTVYVDSRNNGVCTAHTPGRVIQSGTWKFVGGDPSDMGSHVKITTARKPGTDDLNFSVAQGDATGTVTVVFSVAY
jgi:hypothetical protein